MTAIIFATSCNTKTTSKKLMNIIPPKADKVEKHIEKHGDVRIDKYYWLNDKDDEEVI